MSGPCFGRVSTSPSLYHWKAFTNLGSLPQQIYRWPNWTKDGQLLNFRVVKHQRKKYRRDMLHYFASSYVKLKRLGQELDIWHMIAHDQWSRFHLSRIFSAFEALEQRHRWKERIYIEDGSRLVGTYNDLRNDPNVCQVVVFKGLFFFCQVKIGRRFPLAWLFFHMSSDQNPGYLLYIRDYTSQVYRD